jgi:hypothetical protein
MPPLVRLYIRHCVIGFGLAAVFVGLLFAFDVARLWTLVSRSDIGLLAAFMLFMGNGLCSPASSSPSPSCAWGTTTRRRGTACAIPSPSRCGWTTGRAPDGPASARHPVLYEEGRPDPASGADRSVGDRR